MGSQEPLRIGIIGCGEVAEHKHLRALQKLPGAEVVAVADLDPHRAARVADRYAIAQHYTRPEDLLADSSIDAVGICTPAQAHEPVALAALEARKHMLIEKPLALSLDACERLIERARAFPQVKVMVGHHMRHHRLVRQAAEMLRRHNLGSIESIRSLWNSPIRYDGTLPSWRYDRAAGGGALVELAVHHIDLWRFLLQCDVEEVYAQSRLGRYADECAVITARLTGGVLASAVFSERTSHAIEIDVSGHQGRLHLSLLRFDGLQVFSVSDVPGSLRTRARQILHALKELPHTLKPRDPGGEYMASYRAQWRHFIDCIRQGVAPEPTLEDGRLAVQVMLAAVESATHGSPVVVAEAARSVLAVDAASRGQVL